MTLIDDSDDGGEDDEQDQPLVNLKDKLRELTETHDLVLKHGHAMLRQLAEVDGDQVLPPAGAVAKVKEKIAMFKLTTGAMMKVHVISIVLTSFQKILQLKL